MTREETLQAAYAYGFEKGGMSRGLNDVPLGAGPAQMETALRLLGQARALGTPTDNELANRSLSRKDFNSALNAMRGKAKLSDARANKTTHSVVGGLAGALGGAGVGALSGSGTVGKLIAALGGAGIGVLTGRAVADSKNERVLNALKVLKDRGVLTPSLLATARPILS